METELISLDILKPGEKAIIRSFNGFTTEGSHLMEMGIMIGTSIQLIKYAPLGDPLELRVRGYHLSIRRSEAKSILVEKEES